MRIALHVDQVEAAHAAIYRGRQIAALAHGGQVLLSAPAVDWMRRLLPPSTTLRDLGLHRLRDLQGTEQIFEVVHPKQAQPFPPLRSLDHLPHNLPLQLTRFIGRDRGIEQVEEALTGAQLVTLTGLGGTGKTCLFLQAAADLLEHFPDGVWLVHFGRHP